MTGVSDSASDPRISIVIPVYNEIGLIRPAVVDLLDRIRSLRRTAEILLVENGSTDGTRAEIASLVERFETLRLVVYPEPNYGAALREGIRRARGEYVICDEIDLCDVDFHGRALERLEADQVDLVVGSKRMRGSRDERPVFRKAASQVINGLLRLSVGFRGTDTHGLKAFRRDKLAPLVEACVVDRDLFASELVVRAWRSDSVRVEEIPVRVREMREPSVRLTRRVPAVLLGLVRLTLAVRLKP